MNKALITATVLATTTVAGCSAATDRSGGPAAEPTTLVMASNDGSDVAGAPGVQRFVELVAELSDGRVHVEASADWRQQGEGQVLEDVAAGEADLGWTGTRAFDLIGVDTFRPLHAAFLVNSYPSQAAVLTAPVAERMLEGVDAVGLTGLAIMADELRFPAAAEGPLLDGADFKELAFGIMPSNVQAAAVDALGAEAEGMSLPHPPDTDGLAGLETSWRTYVTNGQHRFVPFITANAVLWPRSTVVVANPAVLQELSNEDRDAVTEAATRGADWSIEHAGDRVADEMATACTDGARVATASPDQLAELRRIVEPVYTAMRAEPEQAELLAAVEEAVRDVSGDEPLDVPEGCAYEPGDASSVAVPVLPAVLSAPGRAGQLPAGTYRYSLSPEELGDSGIFSTSGIQANAGVWTWTMGEGRWSYELKPSSGETPPGYSGNTCEGYYDVHGDKVDFTTITVYAEGECASRTWKATWGRTEQGLSMDVTTDGEDLDFLFGAAEWQLLD